MRTKICLLTAAVGAALLSHSAMAGYGDRNKITEAEVLAAQQAWGEALIQISRDFNYGGLEKAQQTARSVLETAYAFQHGEVLFKPTLASGEHTFRNQKEYALSYFVGGNDRLGDPGFALKGWESFQIENAGVVINGQMALTMGHVMLTDADGNTTKVDKTWGFQRFDDGQLRIVLHHSSLPFTG
ncbi:MAG: phosphoribosyl-AMP cyclohydrolase [Wenzhouxiangella sp.]|nr:phosphoribosyl-AMP cyclohydrolase [Wenzhouxiangella sp.]MCH8477591.1 phosphoribosyl-AMP cyclohydrolase [Wenzhouxiangella sp.]TVR97198.1 MAG: phosphoribosyl-AMP cyclohydrolase [Wenzhouxiangellaceae bacterium]